MSPMPVIESLPSRGLCSASSTQTSFGLPEGPTHITVRKPLVAISNAHAIPLGQGLRNLKCFQSSDFLCHGKQNRNERLRPYPWCYHWYDQYIFPVILYRYSALDHLGPASLQTPVPLQPPLPPSAYPPSPCISRQLHTRLADCAILE